MITIWMMDTEFCTNCGNILGYEDTDFVCWLCREEQAEEEEEDNEYRDTAISDS